MLDSEMVVLDVDDESLLSGVVFGGSTVQG